MEGRCLEDYQQLEMKKPSRGRYICAPKDIGWNPRRLPDRTYLAAYLVYWLSSFVVPQGEEEYLRPGLIYPACLLAEGHQLALAPMAPKKDNNEDIGWQYGTALGSRHNYKCNYCGHTGQGGGVSRLKKHLAGGRLAGYHDVQGCKSVPAEVKRLMIEHLKGVRAE
ncbi:hypothetical protein Taro_034818 [Colocasia esculenta]|uniref:BED-type domain-containing protein n=1 Tax=Colocasia esculenta TaxID=4460 RepID=A0A843VXD3_COLES|nr:hypothetical protein [Colocasia esculenta]